jgi:ribosome maturation factor RimP
MTETPMPTTFERERQLQGEIAPRVERDLPGVDVLAVELVTPSRFRVYVDHPEGVDHALCERVTDVLRDYLREYSVEVSSPGLDRPLRRQEHFEAARGRRVRVRTTGRRLRGEVVSACEQSVTVAAPDGAETEIPYAEIVRANLIDDANVKGSVT